MIHSLLTLNFYGKTLREKGIDGPYVLDRLKVQHHLDGFALPAEVASARSVYTTTAYTAAQFDGDALRILATGERAEDLTADGLYDSLSITATFDVLQPGVYEWHGVLVAANGAQVAQATGRGQLSGEQPAVFAFTGQSIRAAGLDGPYTLTDVFVTRLEAGIANFYFDDVHSTAPYLAVQFGATPVVLNQLEQATIDLDGNGLYDQLVISATVAAIDREGDYRWRGHLFAPDGSEVGAVYGSSQLYRGKTLTFAFFGAAFRNAGGDGPYVLRNVTIENKAVPTQTMTLPLLYTTPPLQGAQFGQQRHSRRRQLCGGGHSQLQPHRRRLAHDL